MIIRNNNFVQKAALLATFMLLLVSLAACSTGGAQYEAFTDLDSLVAEARGSVSETLESSMPGQDLEEIMAMDVGQDLRGLSRDKDRLPGPPSGMIALDQTGEDVIVEAFFSARGNTGGFSNRNEYFYVCARLAGVPGEPQVTAEAMSCPGWAVEQLADSTWIEIDLDEVLRG